MSALTIFEVIALFEEGKHWVAEHRGAMWLESLKAHNPRGFELLTNLMKCKNDEARYQSICKLYPAVAMMPKATVLDTIKTVREKIGGDQK